MSGRPAADVNPPALEMRGIVRDFGPTRALDGVDFVVRQGSVHALLGENGAGKTTLMYVAHGVLDADAGTVALFGKASAPRPGGPRAGVGMVHQHLSLVPGMTAEENFELGGNGALRLDRARVRLEELAGSSGLPVTTGVPLRELSLVQQQRLEILKALGRDARLLIMDEPTAVLAPDEVRQLLDWIRGFAKGGGSVVLVTHKLREALAVADDITVLRRGRVIRSGAAAETSERELATAMMPGGVATQPAVPGHAGDVCVRARNLSLRGARGATAVVDASFDLARGEIVGIAAVEGAGHRELLAALARLAQPAAGSLELPPRIAYVPADRRREALVPELTLTENVALHGLGARRGRMPWNALRSRTRALVNRFGIVAASTEVPADTMSGGNQQRLVVARELELAVDLVVADNPARGLDLNASAFVNEQLRAAARAGAAVVIHSSDLDEVLALAERVLVVFNGRVTEAPLEREMVGRAMLGTA